MELVWRQVSLEGVGRDTGFQAGEEGGQDEGNSGDSEREADPRDTVETEMPGHGKKLVTRTGQAQGWQGRGQGRFQVSGQLEGCGDFQ